MLQPFAHCRLTLDTLVLQQNAISKNVAETLARWVKEGEVTDIQRLVQFLLDKFVVRCCLERDENGRAAGLHVDDSSLVRSFLSCLHLIGELDQEERDIGRLLELVGRSQKSEAPSKSSHLSIFEKMFAAYDGEGRNMADLQEALGGSFQATCRFESLAAPSETPIYPISSSIRVDDKEYFRSRALDLKKLEEYLYPAAEVPDDKGKFEVLK